MTQFWGYLPQNWTNIKKEEKNRIENLLFILKSVKNGIGGGYGNSGAVGVVEFPEEVMLPTPTISGPGNKHRQEEKFREGDTIILNFGNLLYCRNDQLSQHTLQLLTRPNRVICDRGEGGVNLWKSWHWWFIHQFDWQLPSWGFFYVLFNIHIKYNLYYWKKSRLISM